MKGIVIDKINWGGFFSFGEGNSFEFKPGFYLISGKNGVGKSSFFNLVPLSLFDKCPSSNKFDSVNKTLKNGYINVDFFSDDKRYYLEYKRSMNRFEWVLSQDGLRVAEGKGVGKFVEDLFGIDYNQFINVFYLVQNGYLSLELFNTASGSKAEMFDKMFGLGSLDGCSELALSYRNNIVGDIDKIKSEIASLERDLEHRKYLEEDLKAKEESLKSVMSILESLDNDISKKQKAIKKYQKEIEEMQSISSEIEKLIKRESELAEELVRIRNDKSDVLKLINKLNEYESAKTKINVWDKEISELTDEIRELEKEEESWRSEVATIKSEINHVKNRLSSLMSEEGVCDKCGSVVSKEHLQGIRKDLEKELGELRDDIEMAEMRLKDVKKALDKKQARLTTVKMEKRDFDSKFSDVKNTRKEELENRISELDKREKNLVDELSKVGNEKSKLMKESGKEDVINAVVESLKQDLNNLLVRKEELVNKEYAVLVSSINSVKKSLEGMKDLEKRIENYNNSIIEYTDLSSIYNFWISGFKKLKIMRLMSLMDTAVSIMNDILKEFGIQCWFEVLKKKKKSKAEISLDDFKVGMDLMVKIGNKPEVPVYFCSGGEKQVIAMAFILSISRMMPVFNILMLDEIFGALDDVNLQMCVDMLKLERRIASLKDKCVLFVTHNQDLADRLDWDGVYSVENRNGLSFLREND